MIYENGVLRPIRPLRLKRELATVEIPDAEVLDEEVLDEELPDEELGSEQLVDVYKKDFPVTQFIYCRC